MMWHQWRIITGTVSWFWVTTWPWVTKSTQAMSTTLPNSTLLHLQMTPIKFDSKSTLPFTTYDKYRIETCTTMAAVWAEIKKFLLAPRGYMYQKKNDMALGIGVGNWGVFWGNPYLYLQSWVWVFQGFCDRFLTGYGDTKLAINWQFMLIFLWSNFFWEQLRNRPIFSL